MTGTWNTNWLGAFGAGALALLISVLTWLAIHADRRSALRTAEERTATIGRMLIAHADAALENANKVILAIEPMIIDWDLQDPEKGKAIFERLNALLLGSPQITAAWVLDGRGLNRLDTWSYPSRAIDGSHRPYFVAHVQGKPDPVIRGDVLPGSVTGKQRFTFSRAIRARDGTLKVVVAVGVYREAFEALYAETVTWGGARAGLYVEGVPVEQAVLARLLTSEQASPDFIRELQVLRSRIGRSGTGLISEEGVSRVVSWHDSAKYPGLYGSASQPIDAVLDEWRLRSLFMILGATIGFTALCGAAYLSFRLARERDSQAIQMLLARELHHRVKNSLQMVNGLLSMRAAKTDNEEAKSALLAGSRQIMAFASIYDILQNSDTLNTIPVSALINELSARLQEGAGVSVEFAYGEDLVIDGGHAGNVAVIANELITNAIKHARSKVVVRCDRDETDFYLRIDDDGPGFPMGFSLQTTKRFGLNAAARLSRLMEGELAWSNNAAGGAGITVRLPIARLARA